MFLAPVLTIGACTVEETFLAHKRGRRMGIWGTSKLTSNRILAFTPLTALMATIGPSLGPVTYVSLILFRN